MLFTSGLADQRAGKALFTCMVFTNKSYLYYFFTCLHCVLFNTQPYVLVIYDQQYDIKENILVVGEQKCLRGFSTNFMLIYFIIVDVFSYLLRVPLIF